MCLNDIVMDEYDFSHGQIQMLYPLGLRDDLWRAQPIERLSFFNVQCF